MNFVAKFPILSVPVIEDREKFCRFRCPVTTCCYMCKGIDEEEIRGWLDEIDSRYLYIVRNEKKPRRRRCIWCKEGNYEEAHFKAHDKTPEMAALRETQLFLYKELVNVQRTGRWWGIAATIGHCQSCPEPGFMKCSLNESPRNKNRCIFALCLDVTSLFDKEDLESWWEYGFVIV